MLLSQTCTQDQIDSPTFRDWAIQLGLTPGRMHRKDWDWCYIVQALQERGMLAQGKRGLGFAVGKEPLSAVFARDGCEIVATDLDARRASEAGWVHSAQHSRQLDDINARGICPADEFRERVRFEVVDMNHIPAHLTDFDFCWSSCSLEHLGSLGAGSRFLINMTRCLKPGGVGVHTTEFNVSSLTKTTRSGWCVLFRQRDLLLQKTLLESLGHHVEPFDFSAGRTEADRFVDLPPYKLETHLKLKIKSFVATSFGLIVTAGDRQPTPDQYRQALRRTYGIGDLMNRPHRACSQLLERFPYNTAHKIRVAWRRTVGAIS